jgi:hypothetical protein
METINRAAKISEITRSDEKKGYSFIISDESVDSHGTVFRTDGWQHPERFSAPVTYGHPDISSPNPDDASIALSDIEIDSTTKQMRAFISDDYWDTGNEIADKVRRKLENGTLKDASIRAQVEDGYMGKKERGEDPDVFYFTNSRLMDWGIVAHGSNLNAGKRMLEVIQRLTKVEDVEEKEVFDLSTYDMDMQMEGL